MDPRIILNWKEKGSDETFGPFMLSDGTIRFIALAALLQQPEDQMPGLVILDEPELGLHPYAIQRLGTLLRMASGYSQIIVSTQSEILLDQLDEEDILITDYDDLAQSSVIRRLKHNELMSWLEDYSLGKLWEKNILGGNP